MAKRGTLTHRRTRRLAALLKIPLPCALGVMEAVWHVTAAHAPAGDLGRLPDQDLADELYWDGDASALVGALLGAGVLERHPEHRLVVHGWSEHADSALRHKLKRAGSTFWDGAPPFGRGQPPQDGDGPPSCDSVTASDHDVTPTDADKACEDENLPTLPAPFQQPANDGSPPDPPASGGDRVEPAVDVQAAPGRAPRQRAGPVVVDASPPGPTRRHRMQALRNAADALERYWIALGGHPGPADRRRLRDALRSGHSELQLRGSVAELVRDGLVAAGKLGADDPWPPPGRAPYDGAPTGEGPPAPSAAAVSP